MSTWGPGNFDNDSAGDFLSNVFDQMLEVVKRNLTSEIVDARGFIEDHGDSQVMPAIAIVIALYHQLDMSIGSFEDEDVKEWKRLFLRGWDKEIDSYFNPDDELRIARRKVIEETFDELISIV